VVINLEDQVLEEKEVEVMDLVVNKEEIGKERKELILYKLQTAEGISQMQGQQRSEVESQFGPSTSRGVGPVSYFTPNQYNQILQMLKKHNMNEINAHMAGTFAANCSSDWIVDSGASNHMVRDLTLLKPGSSVKNPGRVQLANGDTTLITNSGSSQLKGGDSDSTDVLQSHSTDVLHDTNLEFMEDSQAEISMNANAVEDYTALLPALETASTYNVPGEEGNHIDNHVVMTQRRSSRSSKAPLWQQDFVLTKSEKSKHQSNCLYSISDNIDYSGLSRKQLPTDRGNKAVGDTSDSLLLDPGEYQRLVGRLLYLTPTRPDISYAVQSLSQFMQAPKVSHMNAAIRVVKYVKQSPGFGILLTTQSNSTESLQAYCDADWGSCVKF
uniref:Retrovirus-related Pol polyprotein from transposon TNT 1-94-like beta-barrel domain-containing protein n=1 Tax=Solanum lycopersicum TaxID=4081 RepID=A0A3Q7GUS2_SOLLC